MSAGRPSPRLGRAAAICERLVAEAAALCAAQRVLLVLEGADGLRVAGCLLPTREKDTALLQAVQPWLDEARRSGKAKLRHGPAGAGPSEQRSCIVVPLRAGRDRLGFLYADVEGRRGRFTPADRDGLAALAGRGAEGLAGARIADALALQAQQRAGELALIDSIQQGMAAGLGFQGIVDRVGDRLRQVFGSEDLSLRWWDAQADTVISLYTVEHGRHLPKRPPSQVRATNRAAAQILRQGVGCYFGTRDEQLAAGIGSAVPGTDWCLSIIGAPIRGSRRVLGMIVIENHEREHAYGDADLRALTTIGATLGVALENARLFDETQRLLRETEQRNAELAVINSIQQGLASQLDLQAVIDLVGDKLGEIFLADVVGIALFDRTRDVLSYPYLVDHDERFHPAPNPHGLTTGIGGVVMRTRQPAVFATAAEMSSFQQAHGVESKVIGGSTIDHSFVYAPMLRGDDAIGLICIGKQPPHAFGASDVSLITTVAASLSVALQNAQSFEAERQRAAELAIISAVQQTLAGELSLQGVYDAVGDKLRDVFVGSVVGIRMHDPAAGLFHHVYHAFADGSRVRIDSAPPSGMGRHVLETGRALLVNENIPEAAQAYGSTSLMPDSSQPLPKAQLTVPLRTGDFVRGVLTLSHMEREHAYGDGDVRLLETLAGSMAVALENARLFEETQRLLKETEQRNAELAVINGIQQGMAAELDFQAIVDVVGEKLREVFDSRDLFISMKEDGDAVAMLYSVEHGVRQPPRHFPAFGDRPFTRRIRAGETIVVGNAADQAALDMRVVPGTDMPTSGIYVPIMVGPRFAGFVGMENYERESAFDAAAVRLLETVTSAMSVALENARLFDETQRLLKETERRNAELAVINSIQQGLVAQLDLRAIVDLVGDKLREVFGSGDLSICWFDESTYLATPAYFYEHGKRLENVAPFNVRRNEVNLHLLRDRTGVAANSKAQMSSHPVPGTEMPLSYMRAPVVAAGRVIAVVNVDDFALEDAFSDDDVRLLSTVCTAMGMALQSAQLFDETQRLLRETEERAAELVTINSIQQGIAAKLDFQGIVDLVGDKLREVFASGDLSITLKDSEPGRVTMWYGYEHGVRLPHRSYAPRFDKPLWQALLVGRECVVGSPEEIAQWQLAAVAGTDEAISAAHVPISGPQGYLGHIVLEDFERAHAFGPAEIRLLQTLASSLAVALENARLFDETQRLLKETEQRAAELALINGIQEGMAAELNFQAIVDLVGDKLVELFAADTLVISWLDEPAGLMHLPYGVERGRRLHLAPYRIADVMTGRRWHDILLSRRPVTWDNHDDYRALDMLVAEGTEMSRSGLAVPIFAGDRLLGFMSVENMDRENAFGAAELRLMSTVAASLGVALENARLFDETQRLLKETEQRNAQLAVINSIQQGISGTLDFQGIFDLVGDTLLKVLALQDIGIWWFDLEAGLLLRPYDVEHGVRLSVATERIRPGSMAEKLIATRQPQITHTAAEEAAKYAVVPGTDRCQCSALVPIIANDRVLGALILDNFEREHAFGEAEVRLLQTVATSMGVALENARLFDETQRRARESQALSDVGRDLSSSLDLATVMDRIAGHAKDLLRANNSAIFLPDAGGRTHRAIVAVGDAAAALKATAVETGVGIIGSLLESGRPERINDTGADPRGVQIPGTASREDERLMVVPLLADAEVQGAMAVWRNGGQPFEAHELEFLVGLSRQATVALQNARLFNETQESLARQTATSDVLRVISESPTDVQPVFDIIAERAASLTAARYCLVTRLDGDQLRLASLHGINAAGTSALRAIWPQRLADSTSISARAIRQRDVVNVADLLALPDAEYAPAMKRAVEAAGFRSGLSVPMMRDQQVIGAITVNRAEPGLYAEKEVALLQTFARQAVVAIENVRLFNETKAALERQTATAEVLQVVSSSMADAQPVFEKIVECCERLFPAQAFALGIVEDGQRVSLPVYRLTATARAELGASEAARVEADMHTAFPRPLAGTLTERAIASGRLVEIRQVQDGADTAQPGVQAAARLGSSMVVAPLMWEGRGIGSLSMMRKDADSLRERDNALLRTFADQAVIAIQNARLFNEAQAARAAAEAANEAKSAFQTMAPPGPFMRRSTYHA